MQQLPVPSNLRGGMRLQSTNALTHNKVEAGTSTLGPCKICIFVILRIQKNNPYTLPSICVDLFGLNENKDDFATCHLLLAALSSYGPSVRDWLNSGTYSFVYLLHSAQRSHVRSFILWFVVSLGCYRTEEYGAVERLQPCPAHIICSRIESVTSLYLSKKERDKLKLPAIGDKPAVIELILFPPIYSCA